MTTPEPRDGNGDVTRLLLAVRQGAAGAETALADAVYQDLRQLAGARMRQERDQVTLQATALVHEAWLRLRRSAADFEDRRHFFGAAARVMRQILVDRYRRRHARGGGDPPADAAPLDELEIAAAPALAEVDLIALDEALATLETRDPRMAQIVQLRYFAGLSVDETAAALELSARTVKREWAVARAWLFQRMG